MRLRGRGRKEMEDEEFTESECRKERGKKKERLSLDAGGDAAWGVGSPTQISQTRGG